MQTNPDLALPTGLAPEGRAAARIIRALLAERQTTYTGGCRAFYSPAEWRARGEEYGKDALLILVHDGGDLAAYCNPAYEDRDAMIALRDALSHVGLYAEQCTGWYTAVYARPRSTP